MTTGPRGFSRGSRDGNRMSVALPWRARALGLVVTIALLACTMAAASSARGVIAPPSPAQLEVTVVLDKSAYLSGDTATARAVVYRTPATTNYTYLWRARNTFNAILNETRNGTSTYRYTIPLNYVGLIRFEATVDDRQGNTSTVQTFAFVSIAVIALRLDRGEFTPGDTITAFYSVKSNVILNVTYDYDVVDSAGTRVANGTTRQTFFSFTTPNPASRLYNFGVTARDGPNSTESHVTIGQVSGFVLGVTLDKSSYVAGETIRAHLVLTPRVTTQALPIQFRWSLSLGSSSVSAITTTSDVDLFIPVPNGVGTGEIIMFATESSTFTTSFQTVRIGGSAQNALWSTEIGGIPAFAVLLGLLFILLLVAVVALWRRVGGRMPGPLGGKPAPPPPPEGPVRASPTSPMSVNCRHCGKPIDLTTSKRPIEVMCPSCGETQFVA